MLVCNDLLLPCFYASFCDGLVRVALMVGVVTVRAVPRLRR